VPSFSPRFPPNKGLCSFPRPRTSHSMSRKIWPICIHRHSKHEPPPARATACIVWPRPDAFYRANLTRDKPSGRCFALDDRQLAAFFSTTSRRRSVDPIIPPMPLGPGIILITPLSASHSKNIPNPPRSRSSQRKANHPPRLRRPCHQHCPTAAGPSAGLLLIRQSAPAPRLRIFFVNPRRRNRHRQPLRVRTQHLRQYRLAARIPRRLQAEDCGTTGQVSRDAWKRTISSPPAGGISVHARDFH